MLGLGDSIGTDWVRFASGGANVHYCSPTQEPITLTQLNFDVRGLKGTFHRSSLTALPFLNDSMDVVCLSAMEGPIHPLEPVIAEVYRVLRPGGKILAALPAKYDARFWQVFWFPWRRLFVHRPEDQPYSGRMLKRLFGQFTEPRIDKRHLRRSDIPHVWRWMLLPILERVMGRYLVVKTFKPLAAGLPSRVAA